MKETNKESKTTTKKRTTTTPKKKVSKKSKKVVKENKRINFEDIEDYSIFMDVVKKGDIVAAPNIQATDVKQIVFKEMNESKRLLFAPDTYLDSLIKMYINGRKGI